MKAKKRPPISQKAFDKKMEEMGYEWSDDIIFTPTGGGCEGYAKEVSMFGKEFRVLFTSDAGMPEVDECLSCTIRTGDYEDGWNLTFSDAKVLLQFAEKVEEHMKKAWVLLDDLQRWNGMRVDSDFFEN